MALTDQLLYFSYHFVIAPILFAIPILIIFAVVIPIVCYRHMCRKSVVDRLRETEDKNLFAIKICTSKSV